MSAASNMAPTFTPLILAGGKSTRMGSPKHLLQLPDGTPLYQHQINILRQACPDAQTIYISVAPDSPLDAFLQNPPGDAGIELIHDSDTNTTTTNQSGGPAQGLLAAFARDPEATWLVLAVDYPLVRAQTLVRLQAAYEAPVTCFRNESGFCEPLVGIWGPEALRRLRDKDPGAGPSAVVREMGGRQIDVLPGADGDGDGVLRNVNTVAEWEDVLGML